jgi:hypothetical protein
MNNLARNLMTLGIALGIWGISFLFTGDSTPDDPTRENCHAYLDQIQRVKKQWATDKNKPGDAVPTVDDLLPYFAKHKLPECPGSGKYAINAVTNPPQCSITTHTYP